MMMSTTAITSLDQRQSSSSSPDSMITSTPPIKLRHCSSTSTRSSNSTSSSFDDIDQCCAHIQPNDIILEHNQAIAIEVPPNTLKIDLAPFKLASEVHPEPGDIVEFDRTLFSQWAIYVGDGDVVQIVGSQSQEVPDLEIAIVQRVPLIAAAGENCCRVNNKIHRARERNLLPFHNEIVARKALSKVGSTVPYNMLQCNSEHYVTEWKYGHRWSDQAQVSLNSFKALRRQHTNSLSESHTVFVNTLNEVLNSPAITTASSTTGASASSPTTSLAASPPIAIGRSRNARSNSISSNSQSPPSFSRMSSSFNTNASCQTELSLL